MCIILSILILTQITSCQNQDVLKRETEMQSNTGRINDLTIAKTENVNHKYFEIEKVSAEKYILKVFDKNNKRVYTQEFPKEPYVVMVEDSILKVTVSVGSPANYTGFYDIKNTRSSYEYFFNLISYCEEKASFMDGNKLIITNVFDKSKLYKEIERDFPFVASGAVREVNFIGPNKINIKYLYGKDLVEKEEIIEY